MKKWKRANDGKQHYPKESELWTVSMAIRVCEDMSNHKDRFKFKRDLFKRYYTKHKIVFGFEDMINLSAWMSSREFQESTDDIPLQPFLDSGVFYFEACLDFKNSGEHLPVEENRDKQVNCVTGLVFDKVGEDEYSFKLINPTHDKGVPFKHFLHFTTTQHTSGDPSVMKKGTEYDGSTSPTGMAQKDTKGTFQFKKINGSQIQVIDADYVNLPESDFKQIAVDVFQKWIMVNYFMLNFNREIIAYEYDGTAALAHMPEKTNKQRAAKSAIVLGKIYKVIVTDEWLARTKREHTYYISGGERSGFWGLRRVKSDYWERYPERLADTDNYRTPTEETVRAKTAYLPPLEWDEMFIETRQEPTQWHRNPNLLNDGVGEEGKPNQYRINRKAS